MRVMTVRGIDSISDAGHGCGCGVSVKSRRCGAAAVVVVVVFTLVCSAGAGAFMMERRSVMSSRAAPQSEGAWSNTSPVEPAGHICQLPRIISSEGGGRRHRRSKTRSRMFGLRTGSRWSFPCARRPGAPRRPREPDAPRALQLRVPSTASRSVRRFREPARALSFGRAILDGRGARIGLPRGGGPRCIATLNMNTRRGAGSGCRKRTCFSMRTFKISKSCRSISTTGSTVPCSFTTSTLHAAPPHQTTACRASPGSACSIAHVSRSFGTLKVAQRPRSCHSRSSCAGVYLLSPPLLALNTYSRLQTPTALSNAANFLTLVAPGMSARMMNRFVVATARRTESTSFMNHALDQLVSFSSSESSIARACSGVKTVAIAAL